MTLKYKLQEIGKFSEEEAKLNTTVENINDTIDRLLDDEKMMENKNDYSLEERTRLATISLFRDLFFLASDEYYKERECFSYLRQKIQDFRKLC